MRYVCYTSGPAELHTQSLLALRSIPPPAAPKQTRSRDTVSPEGHTRSKKAQAPQIPTDPAVLGARYTPRPLQLQPAAANRDAAQDKPGFLFIYLQFCRGSIASVHRRSPAGWSGCPGSRRTGGAGGAGGPGGRGSCARWLPREETHKGIWMEASASHYVGYF